ncbi:MAG: aminoacyl-tRNA hydrolase [Verrucomicrobiota bacterium]
MSFQCIVGLGNPGSKYVDTRHNIGFRVLDRLASRDGWEYQKVSWATLQMGKHRGVSYLKPQSYMNRSGEPLQQWLSYFRLSVENVLVIVDDVELDLGQIRIRASGGCGGHNGLRSIEEVLGTQQYVRIRCGVGKCPQDRPLEDYVLQSFTANQKEAVERLIDRAVETVDCCQSEGLEKAMNKFNRKMEEL